MWIELPFVLHGRFRSEQLGLSNVAQASVGIPSMTWGEVVVNKLTLLFVALIALVGCSSPFGGGGHGPKPAAPGTLSIGDTVRIGDWEVTVVKITENANAIMEATSSANEAPRGQYVLVDYSAEYVGKQHTANTEIDLQWSITDSSKKVHSKQRVIRTPADAEDQPTTARPGGTITQQVVFDVDPTLLAGAIVTVQDFDTYADYKVA